MSALRSEGSPLKQAASFFAGALFSGAFSGLEPDDDSCSDSDDDVFEAALKRKYRSESEDEEEDDEDNFEEDENDPFQHLYCGSPARPARPSNNNRTDAEYWLDRCSKPEIQDALDRGCRCGCVANFSSGAVFMQRVLNADRSTKQRKENAIRVLKCFYSGATGDVSFKSQDGLPCCRKGWQVEQGFHDSYISRALKSVKKDILGGDPGYGGEKCTAGLITKFMGSPLFTLNCSCSSTGKRLAGACGRDQSTDSIKSMHVRNWLTERLPNWSDHDPTSERIELEKMTHDELYYTFVMDMLDLESLPLADVPLLPLFLHIWKSEFSHVVIRELKTVDSKDKARPGLFSCPSFSTVYVATCCI